MKHEMHRVTEFEIIGPYQLRVCFEDGVVREIDFLPILKGQLYSPLMDLDVFNRVRIEPGFCTLVWPNDADFDPDDLHDWPDVVEEFTRRALEWEEAARRREPLR